MKTKVAFLLLSIACLCGCAPANTGTTRTGELSDARWTRSSFEDTQAKSRQFATIKNQYESSKDPKLIREMLDIANALDSKASGLYVEWQGMPATYTGRAGGERELVGTTYQYTAELACVTMLDCARFSMDSGDLETAKRLYRHIITSYTGGMFRGYVKKAEFGLEDLSSK